MTGSESAQRTDALEAAAVELAERDPVLARLHAQLGIPHFPIPFESPFASLVRSITYQQIAGAAASAIHGRLVAALGDIVPERMLALSDDELRRVGLSKNKVASLRDLAARVVDGDVVLDNESLGELGDDEVIAQLSRVRGIGPWSAQMFLIFHLHRLDVWPVGDLAVRKGYGLAWRVPTPTPKQLEAAGDAFRPYRTLVAWYCWAVAADPAYSEADSAAPEAREQDVQ
jgi:DNA-3-methyladenine glycosylase II